jgi:GAF domain-containing protein
MSGATDLIVSLSTCLVGVGPEDTTDGLQSVVELLRRRAEPDRVYIFTLAPDGRTFSSTHEALRNNAPSAREMVQNVPVEAFPWGFGRLLRGEVSAASSAAALPPEATTERAAMSAAGIKSFVTVPLRARGKVIGGIGVDWLHTEVVCPSETLSLLRVAGELIAATLMRVDAERERTTLELRLRQRASPTTSTTCSWSSSPARTSLHRSCRNRTSRGTIFVKRVWQRIAPRC